MKYAALFLALMAVCVALYQIGKEGRAFIWSKARPYLLMAVVVAMAVLAAVQMALNGGSFRIL